MVVIFLQLWVQAFVLAYLASYECKLRL